VRLDADVTQEVGMGMPLLEAVEHAASRAGIPVDARVESGRTPIHALERLWDVERFDRIVIPAPAGREPGFMPRELLWMLTHAPSETVILRPDPVLREATNGSAPSPPEQPIERMRVRAEGFHEVPAAGAR